MSKSARRGIVTVVIHDVAPPTQASCRALIDAVREVADIPLTLLVVPHYHGRSTDAAFEDWLGGALRRGDELALHGWTHRDEGIAVGWIDGLRRRWYTAGEGEFSGLSESEAADRLARGRAWFAARGWPVEGFVAPAWLMSSGSRRALAKAEFSWTATLARLIALPSQTGLRSQSVVYSTRAAWRRAASIAWNDALAKGLRRQPLLRIELHPPDVLHSAILASWSKILRSALAERDAMTVSRATRRLGVGAG